MHLYTIATQWLAAAQTWDESVPSARFITWRVSPATGRRFCLDSREVVLYGDMENWRHRILQAWADQTDPMVPADIISVSPHPSNLEPGVAGHVIVQQHILDTHAAALVTIVDPAVNHGLFHRQVHVFEDRSRPEDVLFFIGYHMDCPRVAECQVRLRDVLLPPQTPIPIRDGDAFEVSILRTFLPANWIPPTIPRFIEQDEVALFQVSAVQHSPAAIGTGNLKTGQVADSHDLAPRKCSFTDEFVQAVRRLSEAQDQDPLPMLDSVEDSALPPALRELWELRQTEVLQDGADPATQFRVETWFLDHVNFDRCYHSRIVTLTLDTSTWLHALLQQWMDRREVGARVDIALVYPASEDQAPGTSAQLILTQFPQDDLRSILLSVYDTGRTHPTPRTFGLVHGASISLRSALEEVRLVNDCPPHVRYNECALWFGSTVIPVQRQVYVRTGNAFRLCIRRGQLINLQDLLALPDAQLRRQLQDAIHGEIYRRPPGPGFPGDLMDVNPLPEVPSRPQASSANDQPQQGPRLPQWIHALNQLFAHHSATELLEEGPVLYVQSWYVNGCSHMWCTEPRSVRLTSDFPLWRTAFAQAWHDRIQGSLPAEFWVVQPIPPFSPSQGFTVHVIVSQSLHHDQTAVLLTATQDQTPDVVCQHAAYVLPRRSLGEDLARFAVPPWFRSSILTVLFAGADHPLDAYVNLHSGGNVVVRYGEFDRAASTGPHDGLMMLQLSSRISLADAIEVGTDDIDGIPFSLGAFFSSGATEDKPIQVCVWEMPNGCSDTVMVMKDQPSGDLGHEFRRKHDFLRPVSQLFGVQFVRPEWTMQSCQIQVGSFQIPHADQAIVFLHPLST